MGVIEVVLGLIWVMFQVGRLLGKALNFAVDPIPGKLSPARHLELEHVAVLNMRRP